MKTNHGSASTNPGQEEKAMKKDHGGASTDEQVISGIGS